jgi:hypothetical protein
MNMNAYDRTVRLEADPVDGVNIFDNETGFFFENIAETAVTAWLDHYRATIANAPKIEVTLNHTSRVLDALTNTLNISYEWNYTNYVGRKHYIYKNLYFANTRKFVKYLIRQAEWKAASGLADLDGLKQATYARHSDIPCFVITHS